MGLIRDTALERRCRALVDPLELPDPFTLTALAETVARGQDRRVRLRRVPLTAGSGVSGLVLRTDTEYVVCYPDTTDAWWALMCVSHELAHIICGHLRAEHPSIGARIHAPDPRGTRTDADGPGRDGDTMAAWLPDMQEAITAWGALYRCEMDGRLEREAELTGTLLVQKIETAAGARRTGPGRPGDQDVLARFGQLLGGRRARRG